MTRYMKVKEFAMMRQLSPWTVYRMVERGEIDFERFGRTIRILVRGDRLGGPAANSQFAHKDGNQVRFDSRTRVAKRCASETV